MSFTWEETRVLVTGGAGFIGSHLVDRLVKLGANVTVADNMSRGSLSRLHQSVHDIDVRDVDLSDQKSCLEVFRDADIVFGLAARVAGIQYNLTHSADMFHINSKISLNSLEAARINDVQRYLAVSSACVYARHCAIPTPESDGFLGDPETTNWGYGWAKRFSEVQARAYSEQYGMKIGIVRPYNTYGPRDHFSESEAHVIPALIKRTLSGIDPLEVWGSGSQTRSFIYVDDLVRGMLLDIERHAQPDPVNLGSDEEISIKRLVENIQDSSGMHQKVIFDLTKPEGQPRRRPDVTKARELLGFKASMSMVDGIAKTVHWYQGANASAKYLATSG